MGIEELLDFGEKLDIKKYIDDIEAYLFGDTSYDNVVFWVQEQNYYRKFSVNIKEPCLPLPLEKFGKEEVIKNIETFLNFKFPEYSTVLVRDKKPNPIGTLDKYQIARDAYINYRGSRIQKAITTIIQTPVTIMGAIFSYFTK